MIPTLIVDGIEIPLHAMLDVTQSLAREGGDSTIRMEDGSLVPQYSWERWLYRVSARGTLRPGLDKLNRHTAYEILTADWQDVSSTINVITLPSARRADAGHTPRGYAYVPVNGLVPTAVVLIDDVATLAPIVDATYYIAQYLPQFTALVDFTRERQRNSGEVSWTLVAREQ